jgi:hypothetical protein
VNVAAQNNMSGVWLVPGATYHVHAQYYVPSSEVQSGVTARAGIYLSMMANPPGQYRVLDPRYPNNPSNPVSPNITNLDQWVTIDFNWVNPGAVIEQVNYGSFRLYGGDGTNLSTATFPNPGGYFDNCQISSSVYRNDLHGVVKDNSGNPVEGATIVVSSSYLANMETNTTLADGSYTFSSWAPYGYTFSVNATYGAYGSDGPKSLVVSSTAGTFPLITMTAPSITVSGTVKQTDGTPVEASVRVTAGTYTVGPVVATGGNFSFSPLPFVPSYTISATKVGFAPNPASVTITDPSQPVHIIMNPDPSFNTNLLFSLDAGTLATGNITAPIVNTGAAGGYWTPEGGTPVVGMVGGLPAVTFTSNPRLLLTSDGVTQQNAPMSLINLSPDTVKYTVSAWIYRQASGGGESYLSWSPYQHGTCFQYIGGNGTAVDNWTAGGYINYNPAPNRDEWHFVVVTYDGTSAKAYVDGAQQGSQNTAFACDNIAANYPVRIGCGQQATDFSTYDTVNPIRQFGGSITKLAVYDVAQTPTEIATTWTNNSQPIIASATAGGTISPVGTMRVPTGSAKTFTITPAPGYFIQNVLVDGSSVGTPNTYTFPSVVSPRTIAVTFQALPAQLVSGNVGTGSAGIPGATVYFSSSPNASVNPLFTTTTLTSPAGDYSFNLPAGTWYACASATGYAPSADITFTVTGSPVPGRNITLAANGRNIPAQNNLLFAALSANCAGTTPWPAFMPKGRSLSPMGTPTVSTIGTAQWENNKADGDGFTFTNVGWTPVKGTLTFNGGTIVVAATPTTGLAPNAYQQMVSVLVNQFSIGVQRDTGQLRVWRGGTQFNGPDIPSGQSTVFSVVVQPTGQFTVYANSVQVMNETSTFNFTTLTPIDWYMTDVNVGKGWNGDGWSSFNGDIGDVFVYKTALSDADRKALEVDLGTRFSIPIPNIPFSGKVTLQDGVTPVGGALVTAIGLLSTQTGTSAADGTYSLDVVQGDTYAVDVTKDSYVQVNAGFSGLVSAPTVYNFQMKLINAVTGTVKTGAGVPIYNAVVQVGIGGPAAVSGLDGKYTVMGITPSAGVDFYADALGYGAYTETIDTSAAASGAITKDVVLAAQAETDYSYIQNGGFESGTLAPWVGDNNATVETGVTTADKASGNYAGYWKSKTGIEYYQGYIRQLVPVVAGSTYNIYWKLKTPNSGNEGQSGFDFMGLNNDGILESFVWWGYDGLGNNWMYTPIPGVWEQTLNYRNWNNSEKLMAVRVTPPDGILAIQVIVGLGTTTAGDILYVDDVVVDRVGPVAPALSPEITLPGGVPTFTFPTMAGHRYQIVYKDALTAPSWTALGVWTAADGSPMTLTDPSAPLPTVRFYRLEIQ